MTTDWGFGIEGLDTSKIRGPAPLVSKGLSLPLTPGLYLVTCGDCIAHIGTSKELRTRVRQLATLGTHRGSAEVLCAAFCTRQKPLVWWEPLQSATAARKRERELKSKDRYGEPPFPQHKYERTCKDGRRLRDELVKAAGKDSWEAGYIEAVFEIGEKLRLLFDKGQFEGMWKRIGRPPGPW
ncbi:MAG: hypothetical protein ACE5KH_06535 [Candidatus Geothermarchaeales archaeon]